MGQNDHINEELSERIGFMIEAGHFEEGSNELGIARKVMAEGKRFLTPVQRTVWERGVLPILKRPINDGEAFQAALDRDRENDAQEGSL